MHVYFTATHFPTLAVLSGCDPVRFYFEIFYQKKITAYSDE